MFSAPPRVNFPYFSLSLGFPWILPADGSAKNIEVLHMHLYDIIWYIII